MRKIILIGKSELKLEQSIFKEEDGANISVFVRTGEPVSAILGAFQDEMN